MVLLGLLAAAGLAGAGTATAAPSDPTIVLGGQTWFKREGPATNPRSGAYMMKGNVDTNASGQVVITTKRHCGNVGAEGQPEHPAACQPGEGQMWYSTGRIELPDAALAGQNFTMTATAKLPANAVRGTRNAIWMTNGRYCANGEKSYLGELDLTEMYGSARTTSETNTHISCKDGSFVSAGTKAELFRPGEFNTWQASRTDNAISYRLNGGGVADYTCGVGTFSAAKLEQNGFPNTSYTCSQSLGGGSWRAILQGEVFSATQSGKFAPPDASAVFPTQQMVVTDARVVTQAKNDSPGDLFALNKNDGGTTALHRLQSSTQFQAYSTQTKTGMHETTNPVWSNFMGDFNGDGVLDLYSINRNDQGKTAVHVWNGANNYQTALLHTLTALHQTTSSLWSLDVADFNGDNRDDVYAMYRNDQGRTSVHVLDAASSYQLFSMQTLSGQHETTADVWKLMAGDYDGDGRADLWAVNRNDGGATAAHIYSAASSFQSPLAHTKTAMHATTDPVWRLDVGRYDGDARGDLYALNTNDGGRTAVHVLTGASSLQSMVGSVRTAIGNTSDASQWDVLVAAP
ncbi:VCBS repeat-containing protein [Phycicoccus sp. CSK15P-2]|uniref:FG-GAP repeat domain-containing protein n=1 Tax=Phycicoccus sp. CSK15P-2 TaxID=2807627 RepID=UPI00194EADA4|nr:VCBS repeat-containing protein [Phycicoccus sp. CSK15P-2]